MAFGYPTPTARSDHTVKEAQKLDGITEPLLDGAGGWLSELPAALPEIKFHRTTLRNVRKHPEAYYRFIVDAVKTEVVNGGWDSALITYVPRDWLLPVVSRPGCCCFAYYIDTRPASSVQTSAIQQPLARTAAGISQPSCGRIKRTSRSR